MDRNLLIAAAIAVILLAGGYMLLSQQSSKPDLSISAQISPSSPYVGDVLEFNITVANRGSGDAPDAIVELLVDGRSIAQKTVSLNASQNTSFGLRWLVATAGDYDLQAQADPSQIIQDTDRSNNQWSTRLHASPRSPADVFSHHPSTNLSRIYDLRVRPEGEAILDLLTNNPNLADASLMKLNEFGEARMDIIQYKNGSQAEVLYFTAALPPDEVRDTFTFTLAAKGVSSSHSISVGNRSVEFYLLETSSFCLWHEQGWDKLTYYKPFLPETRIGNVTLGDPTTCIDMVEQKFNSSELEQITNGTRELERAVTVNSTPLFSMRARASVYSVYAKGFGDTQGSYLAMLTDEPAGVNANICQGDIITVGGAGERKICRVTDASIYGSQTPTTALTRRQGPYTINLFEVPGAGGAARSTNALNYSASIVFSGFPDFDWNASIRQVELSSCRFNTALACVSPTYENGTLRMSLTSLASSPLTLNSFRCTQERLGTDQFELTPFTQPIRLLPNASVTIDSTCYIVGNRSFTGTPTFLNSKLYLNYTDETNQSFVNEGQLTINSLLNQPSG